MTSQAVTGVVPPEIAEARIREVWPSLLAVNYPLAMLAKKLTQTYLLFPLGVLLFAPLFKLKFAPFICRRYSLTNRRLMIRAGWKPGPTAVKAVNLADIDEVRCDPAKVDPFFLAGTIEIVSKGQVVLQLNGVPEPISFRNAIINTIRAVVPGKEIY
jgi:hypothetical protein